MILGMRKTKLMLCIYTSSEKLTFGYVQKILKNQNSI